MYFGLPPGRLRVVRCSRDCNNFSRKEEPMQPLSTLPTRDRLTHLEQVYPKPSISSRDTTLMLAQAVIAKEAAALDNLARTLDTSFVSATQLILNSSGHVIFMGVGKS